MGVEKKPKFKKGDKVVVKILEKTGKIERILKKDLKTNETRYLVRFENTYGCKITKFSRNESDLKKGE